MRAPSRPWMKRMTSGRRSSNIENSSTVTGLLLTSQLSKMLHVEENRNSTNKLLDKYQTHQWHEIQFSQLIEQIFYRFSSKVLLVPDAGALAFGCLREVTVFRLHLTICKITWRFGQEAAEDEEDGRKSDGQHRRLHLGCEIWKMSYKAPAIWVRKYSSYSEIFKFCRMHGIVSGWCGEALWAIYVLNLEHVLRCNDASLTILHHTKPHTCAMC